MKFDKLINNTRNGLFGSKNTKVDSILSRSTKAVCGAFEREVIVSSSKVSSTKTLLRGKGFIIVGTGPAGPNSTKIWFNPAGVNL